MKTAERARIEQLEQELDKKKHTIRVLSQCYFSALLELHFDFDPEHSAMQVMLEEYPHLRAKLRKVLETR